MMLGDRYTYVNAAFAAMVGYSEAELIGLDYHALVTEETERLQRDRQARRERGEMLSPEYECTLRRKDGVTLEDDLVNLNGGRPGRFYGVEIDGRAQWKYLDHFAFDLEGALFFPGNAFDDENQLAVRSGLVQGRTTFYF